MKISEMSNEKLLEEYKQMDELINVIECFGVNDLIYFEALAHEMTKREE